MPVKSIVAFVIAALFGTILLGSWYTVDQGERGVILRNGQIIGVVEPGLSFKMPLVDEVIKLSVQSRKMVYPNMATYSRDQQPATMTLSVNYRLNAGDVDTVYSDYGSEQGLIDRLLSPRVLASTKNVFGRFNAVAAIQERERLNLEVLHEIQEAVKGPITIETIQIEEIDFSSAYEQSIEARMLAEVEVQKVKQELERERVQAEIVTTQAFAEATRIREIGQAEADAINARGQSLRDNPDLVKLVQAEKWNGILPATMIPNGALPIIGGK